MHRRFRFFALAIIAGGGLAAAVAGETPRAARSVHWHFPAATGDVFYNEVTVAQSVNGSYFMACGWNTGYFGMQQLGSPTNKVVIFSVWDPTKGNDANQVPLAERVEVLHAGTGARIKRFGGEGTGGQCIWPYAWATNETCRFAVRAVVEGERTSYAGWFFDGHTQTWRHLATFRTRTGGKLMSGYYSFIEDFRRDGKSANEERRAQFGPSWVHDGKNGWTFLRQARFTASNSKWEAPANIDGGIAAGRFYLATGGAMANAAGLGKSFSLTNPVVPPPALPVEF